MPAGTGLGNLHTDVKSGLLRKLDFSQGPTSFLHDLRLIGNSLVLSAGYARFLKLELRSIMHPNSFGLSGIVSSEQATDIDVAILSNPVPKIIFGGDLIDVSVVFNGDAFRIMIEQGMSPDGTSLSGWILAKIPYESFSNLPFGGFLLYLMRKIDLILRQTGALGKYDTMLRPLAVNSVGLSRQSKPQEVEEPEATKPAPGTPETTPASAPKASPAPVAQIKPTPQPVTPKATPEPTPVAKPQPQKPAPEEEPAEMKQAA